MTRIMFSTCFDRYKLDLSDPNVLRKHFNVTLKDVWKFAPRVLDLEPYHTVICLIWTSPFTGPRPNIWTNQVIFLNLFNKMCFKVIVCPSCPTIHRECIRKLDLWVHPGELWVSKQRVHIALEASKSAGAKGDVPKICRFVHPLHLC